MVNILLICTELHVNNDHVKSCQNFRTLISNIPAHIEQVWADMLENVISEFQNFDFQYNIYCPDFPT